MDVVDALGVGEIPQAGQGHFHCQLDGGAIVASVAPRMDWHELSSGVHTVSCYVADNNHQQASTVSTAQVNIA